MSLSCHVSRLNNLFYVTDALLLASQSLPALVLSFFVGHIYDSFEFRHVTVCFLLVQLVGQLGFCFALHINNFPFAIMSLVLFGSGSSAVSVAQRALVVDHYRGSEGFGIGCIHAVSSASKFIGKVSILPAVLLLQSYQLALLLMCLYTVGSLSIALYLLWGSHAPTFHTHDSQTPPHTHDIAAACHAHDIGAALTGGMNGGSKGIELQPLVSTISRPRSDSSRSTTSIQSFNFW